MCGIAGAGLEVRKVYTVELWLVVAAAVIALLLFIGMLMPGGIGPA